MRHMIPMLCPQDQRTCALSRDVVDVEHGPERRHRGTVWTPTTTDTPACTNCGAELKYLND